MREPIVFDTECAPDYFMVGFRHVAKGTVKQYELFAGNPLPRVEILNVFRQFLVIGFNSANYDLPMMFYALLGMAEVERGRMDIPTLCANLKKLSDHIIIGKLRGWQVEQQYGFKLPDYIDHIDLMEPVPGVGVSLKLYGARLHSKRLQDLPYDHNECVFGHAEDRRANILSYNGNDLLTTVDLWREATKPSDDIMQTRVLLGAEFGIDLRSKSDAQIAEAVIKARVTKIKNEPIYRSEVRPGTRYRYQPAPFIRFQTDAMQRAFDAVLASEFVVNEKGKIDNPPQLDGLKFTVGASTYAMGIGGLHSTEKKRAIFASPTVLLRDFDVTSYYPALILLCGLFPPNMGEAFQRVYRDFFERRLAAKKAKHKSTMQTLKILLNGAYGKLGSSFSVLYAPNLMIQVTLTGQLSVLMLIERMELAGIPCVSANTDGIVLACPAHLEARMYEVAKQWERDTGLGLEDTHYRLLANASVNSYVAVTPDGKVKSKGDYALSDAQHNPFFEVSKKAVHEFLSNGTPVAETVLKCRDIRQFVAAQKVKGGAQMPVSAKWIDHWQHNGEQWIMEHNGKTHKAKRKSRPGPVLVTDGAEYLGRVVRWYRSTTSRQHIEIVGSGNKVPDSDNAQPVMTLPDEFPADIDFGFYIERANKMLRDIGVMQ